MKHDLTALSDGIDAYFAECDAENQSVKPKVIKPYTVSGLLYALGLEREEFESLRAKPKYRRLFSSACARIESFIEENALTGALSCNAAMNSLKNSFGWGESKTASEPSKSQTVTLMLDGELVRLAE